MTKPVFETMVLATHNQGKVDEFRHMLDGLVGDLKSAADFHLPEPEETENTFEGNAILKARAAMMATGLPCLADDSGLEVDALGGDPGVYSARWAGPDRDFRMAMREVHDRLCGNMNTGASFVAVLALAVKDQPVRTFEGRVGGTLSWPPRGEKGFGYDPIFVPDGHQITFAEMDPAEKHALSHRARAVEKFKHALLHDV